jgi:hypothetical protein
MGRPAVPQDVPPAPAWALPDLLQADAHPAIRLAIAAWDALAADRSARFPDAAASPAAGAEKLAVPARDVRGPDEALPAQQAQPDAVAEPGTRVADQSGEQSSSAAVAAELAAALAEQQAWHSMPEEQPPGPEPPAWLEPLGQQAEIRSRPG